MIMTRKGSLIPSVFAASAGQVMNVVEMFVDMISRTDDWMSLSVMRLMCPFLTSFSQICSGLLPIEYKTDRKPDWKVFLNISPRGPLSARNCPQSALCARPLRNDFDKRNRRFVPIVYLKKHRGGMGRKRRPRRHVPASYGRYGNCNP